MLHIPNLPIFLVASLILLLTPGPAVIYIVTRSVDQGRLAGFISVLSIETGNFFHVLAVTLGLSAVLVSSPVAFFIIKWLGALYLIYLGIHRIISGESLVKTGEARNQKLSDVYRQGVVVAILNPKTAMFFLAFLPQFVDSARGSVPTQLLVLGCLFVLMAVCTDGLYSLLAGTVGNFIRGSNIVNRMGKYFLGLIYIGLGITAALVGYQQI